MRIFAIVGTYNLPKLKFQPLKNCQIQIYTFSMQLFTASKNVHMLKSKDFLPLQSSIFLNFQVICIISILVQNGQVWCQTQVPHEPRSQTNVPHQPRTNALTSIKVRQDRSLYDIPEIDITFPDGYQDELILEKHYPNDESRLEDQQHCNYFGHLKNEPEACVAVTGCYGRDDLEFSIMSEHALTENRFILEKDGQLKVVESAFNVSIDNRSFFCNSFL